MRLDRRVYTIRRAFPEELMERFYNEFRIVGGELPEFLPENLTMYMS